MIRTLRKLGKPNPWGGPMITLIDIRREVRHTCFHTLSRAGAAVAVFHSVQRFVDCNALFRTHLLLVGEIRPSWRDCRLLRWAGTVRPQLPTLLLIPHRVETQPLCEVCGMDRQESAAINCSDALQAFHNALDQGLLAPITAISRAGSKKAPALLSVSAAAEGIACGLYSELYTNV